MNFEAASISEAGPRAINEDGTAYWFLERGAFVAAIADGLGGMGGGGNASHIALATLRALLVDEPSDAIKLTGAAEAAHAAILEAQHESPELRQMATTLTAGQFSDSSLVGVHCGDSRASIARGRGIRRLTSDHSEGERLFKAGKLTKEEFRAYPRKNILDSALGIHGVPRIETFSFELLPGDKVFFTTDGVHEKLMLREMRDMAERHSDPRSFVDEVRDVISARSAEDNFSIVAVFVR